MPEQTQEFKNKMKVSNPLNDLAANLGVTIKVLVQLATGPDKEFREMVRMLLSALPEEEVVLIAQDPEIEGQFLDYLSRIFEAQPVVLQTLLKNPSTPADTVERVSKLLSSTTAASKPGTETSTTTAQDKKSESTIKVEEPLQETFKAGPVTEFQPDDPLSYWVSQLFEVNFNILADFMKRINQEVLKQLERLTEANRQVLQVLSKNVSSLKVENLRLSPELLVFVMRKLPASVSEQEILEFLKKKGIDQKKTEDEGAEKEEEALPLQEKIRRMKVGEKIKLARLGDMSARRILIRDHDREVALTVLENPRITETEIEAITSMREVSEDVLRAIGNKKEWISNYAIMLKLVKNPKTPVDMSVSYLPRLGKKDLDYLQKSKYIPQVVRNYARAILLQRLQSNR